MISSTRNKYSSPEPIAVTLPTFAWYIIAAFLRDGLAALPGQQAQPPSHWADEIRKQLP